MNDFLTALLFFGPLIAVNSTYSGALLPGAIAVAIFSITRHASFWRNIVCGGFCLSATAMLSASTGSLVEVALFFVASSLPFTLQAFIASGLIQCLHRVNLRLEKLEKENNPTNP